MQQIRRKVRDAAHARELLNEMELSQLPLADFAREKRVDGRSLNMYRLNLESAAETLQPLRLIELVASPPPRSARAVRGSRRPVRRRSPPPAARGGGVVLNLPSTVRVFVAVGWDPTAAPVPASVPGVWAGTSLVEMPGIRHPDASPDRPVELDADDEAATST